MRNVSKKSLFHATTSTRIIAGSVLAATLIILSLFPLSTMFLERITSRVIEFRQNVEESLDVQITFDSVASDVLSRVHIDGIHVTDTSGHEMLSIDTIEISQPLYALLPRYLFSRSIPVEIHTVALSVTEENETHLFEMMKQLQSSGTESTVQLALNGSVTIQDISVQWNGRRYQGEADIEHIKLGLHDGELHSFSSELEKAQVSAESFSGSVETSAFSGILQNGSITSFQGSVRSIEAEADQVIEDLHGEAFSIFFKEGNSLLLSARSFNGNVFIGNDEYAGVSVSSISVDAEGSLLTGMAGTVNTSALEVTYSDLSFTTPALSLTGDTSFTQFSCALPQGFNVILPGNKSVTGKDTSFSYLSGEDSITLYTFSDSISASEQLLNAFSSDISFTSAVIDNPSMYAQFRRGDGTSEWEADGDLTLDLTSPVNSSMSALMFANGNFDKDWDIESLSVRGKNVSLSMIDALLEGSFDYSSGEEGKNITAEVRQGNSLEVAYSMNLESRDQSVNLSSQSLLLEPYREVFNIFAPEVLSYTDRNSRFTGDFRGSWDPSFTRIQMNVSAALTHIHVGDVTMNGAATMNLNSDEHTFTIPSATVTTEGFRVAFNGEIDRGTLFPRGELVAINVETGRSYAHALFSQSSQNVFGYTLSSSLMPFLEGSGTLRRVGDNLISTAGDITLYEEVHPYIASLYLDTMTLEGSIPHLQMRLKLDEQNAYLNGTFDANGFLIPDGMIPFTGDSPRLNGHIEGNYSIPDSTYTVTSPSISLTGYSNLQIENASADLTFTLNESSLDIERIVWEDSFNTINGNAKISIGEGSWSLSKVLNDALISVSLRGEGESVEFIRLMPDRELNIDPAVSLNIDNLNLSRFHPFTENLTASLAMNGMIDIPSRAELEGELELHFLDNESTYTTEISVDKDGIFLENGSYVNGNASITGDMFSYLYDGSLNIGASYLHDFSMIHRDASTTADVKADLTLNPVDNMFEGISELLSLPNHLPDITLSVSNVSLLNTLTMPDSVHTIHVEDDILSVLPEDGGYLDLMYNMNNGDISIDAGQDFLFPMKGEGTLTKDFISLDLSYVEFDFTYINAVFPDPSVFFNTGLMSGSVLIEGDPLNPGYWGTMSGTDLSLSLYWLPGVTLKVENPLVSLDNKTFTLPYTSAHAFGDGRVPATGQFSITADFANWNLDSYEMAAQIKKGTIPIYIPITNIDMLVKGEVNGSFSMDGTLSGETLHGDIYAPSAEISFGIPDLPFWYIPRARTSADFTFTSGKNVSFVYPNSESPIVSATVQDNQKMSLSMLAPEMIYSFSGDIGLRSGEIYYVQENFYITEGMIHFQEGEGTSLQEMMPRVSLRARLRKFNTDGERIDIYLNLQNALLTEIEPRFDSIPARTDNEILQLLGQNLLSSGFSSTNDTGYQSVLNAATAATDVITRFGLIQGNTISFGFSSVIREALGLDVFTIRSNLLQNILLDAIPGATDNTNVSPFGRYLDNTTFYLGKYLADELYLQGLISLRRDSSGTQNSFLAPDLSLDTELSVEWLNPLATFSFFTQPNELSLFNIFDTMGFSVTKSIEF